MMMRPRTTLVLACAGLAAAFAHADDSIYYPPASYYSGATGTGSLLKSQLTSAMSAGHIERTYGQFRTSAAIHDQDPDNPSNILLCYNRSSVRATWDSGSTWNREHVWPQSRQPGSASNSTTGPLGDPHALLPCNPSINSSRGNKPFGFADTFGSHRSLGSFYFPGDMDKGDIARILFYMDVRWGPSRGLALVNGTPSGNQMGGLDAAIAWHYLDAPDTFEIRRNHAIYDSGMNPFFYTNNRNAFVDMPETVWSIYVDQANDSTLWVGAGADANGGSVESVTINALVGTDAGSFDVMLNKSGDDGTYYSVEATSGLTTSITGRHNAFAIGSDGDTRTLTVTTGPELTAASGVASGTVTINNLDITTMGGAGNGANDADDVVDVLVLVYDPMLASFESGAALSELTVDLGQAVQGQGMADEAFSIYNIAAPVTGAPMDVELISSSGDTDALVPLFSPILSLSAGDAEMVEVVMDDTTPGVYEATYVFRAYNDRGLFTDPGASQDIVLHLTGEVLASGCPADLAAPFGTLNFFDMSAFISAYNAQDDVADLAAPFGTWNFFDVSAYIDLYTSGCP